MELYKSSETKRGQFNKKECSTEVIYSGSNKDSDSRMTKTDI